MGSMFGPKGQKAAKRHYDDVRCAMRAEKFGQPEAAKRWRATAEESKRVAGEVIHQEWAEQDARARKERERAEERAREERGRGFNWFGN
ncbi:hypothetical protein [Streptomyces sp. SM8]|uniref:hypothetical protein n=1 Tax=Streptomyces sp. SM8 TaxID=1195457 RepID=UPI0002830EC7|nr:hypothetical protein [Streptomyces sp. SM8]PKA35525.1 hypothetical protein SM8_015565 [Streptomyces sp. SM8]